MNNKVEITKEKNDKLAEQRIKIEKLKYKAVIPNSENRQVVNRMRQDFALSKQNYLMNKLYGAVGSVMETQMFQTESLKSLIGNVDVELGKVKKVLKKLSGQDD